MEGARHLRVVLDTNVLLDCWVFDDTAAWPLKAALEARRLVALRSVQTDAELRAVLARPALAVTAVDAEAIVARWCALAALIETVAPWADRLHCSDRDDQKFLDLALSAGAQALFTKDKALLATAGRARTFGLQVLLPAASVRFLQDHAA
jgi:putative PIN family toxin of toxin-antitoxin system